MARKYTKVEPLVEMIMQRHEMGETYREMGVSLGLSRAEVRGAVKRWRRKERKIAAGYKPLPKGRPRKDADNEEVKRNNEVAQLRMTVELLRNFLAATGRR